MSDDTFLTALNLRFDAHEHQLRGVALRMMGSPAEAEEMLAAARAGLGRDEGAAVRAWLTALVGQACVRGLQERAATGPWRGQGAADGSGARSGATDEDTPTGATVGTTDTGTPTGAVAGMAETDTPTGVSVDTTDTDATTGARPAGGEEPARGAPGAARPTRSGRPPTDDSAATSAAGAESATGVESVWLALLVVLESLGAAERIAYVLHDLFGLPPAEAARITGDSPVEVTRLARRARERVRGVGTVRGADDPGRQRTLVDRFLAAARARDARALAAVLDPDVVAYSDRGPVHGAPAVAEGAAAFARFADASRPALVDGSVGAVAFVGGRPVAALTFTFRRERIATLSVTAGEDRVRALDLAFPDW
ncbi:sigma factor-like helix-turn-helix DNA-binding protein [Streptomyces sp. LMG1-1-1.1]|uniref:sigma factor-like helix-turn-helix DNA-binding protein n=1 Tax=Streptomyces sp. LMG1-1-1.1 TaxID=3135245 RepID=UPI003467D456